jgi:hypothetical protein
MKNQAYSNYHVRKKRLPHENKKSIALVIKIIHKKKHEIIFFNNETFSNFSTSFSLVIQPM